MKTSLAGRQEEAITLYHATGDRLATRLGVDPSPALKILYQRIIAQDPNLMD